MPGGPCSSHRFVDSFLSNAFSDLTFPDKRLGLVVAPGEIRLKPQPEDGYAWSVTPEKAYLLDTSLSNGNVSFYQTICKEIGRSLEAVLPPHEVQQDPDDLSPVGSEYSVVGE